MSNDNLDIDEVSRGILTSGDFGEDTFILEGLLEVREYDILYDTFIGLVIRENRDFGEEHMHALWRIGEWMVGSHMVNQENLQAFMKKFEALDK